MSSEQSGGAVKHKMLKCWEAAAYDRPQERNHWQWIRIVCVSYAVIFTIVLSFVAGRYIATQYSNLLPNNGTVLELVLSGVVEAYSMFALILTAFFVMHLLKLTIMVIKEVSPKHE